MAFCDSRTYKEHRTLFKKDREWIWADSAYGLDWWCVTPYKKPASLQPNNKTFNYHLSRVCGGPFCDINMTYLLM